MKKIKKNKICKQKIFIEMLYCNKMIMQWNYESINKKQYMITGT